MERRTRKSRQMSTKLATVGQVRQMLKTQENADDETKYIQYYGTISPSTTGSVAQLSQISQGATDTTRNGDSIKIKSLEFTADVLCAGGVAGGTEINAVRLLLVQWHPISNAAVTIADVLSISSEYVRSAYDHDNMKAGVFKVLWDKTVFMNGYSNAGERVRTVIKGGFHKQAQFIGGSNTNMSNGIYLVTVSDSAAVSHPSFNYFSKLSFFDA